MSKPVENLPKLNLNGAAYGILLILATLLSVIFLAHHPMHGLHVSADQNHLVHGGLIALLILTCVGMSGFAWRIGIEHPAVMSGWLAYVLGTFCLILAGLINGFVVADVPDFTTLLSALSQASTRLGLVLVAVGIIMWGHALLHHAGFARLMALQALAVGGVSMVFILTKQGPIDVTTLFYYLSGQVTWNLSIAFWMIRGLKRPSQA